MIRAKLTVNRIETQEYSAAYQQKTVVFGTVYDQNIPEDQRFQQATPSGEARLQIDNPVALEVFKPGKKFYVDFTETE